MMGTAIISSCGTYRYRLERDFGMLPGSTIAFLMVNPSTADATADDATIRKVIGFASRMGAGRVIVGNLFAYRATDIRALRTVADPVGPENDRHLVDIVRDAQTCIAAWGPLAKLPPPLRTRWRNVLTALSGLPLMCLGTANDGQPLHPLMLSYDRPLVPFAPPPIRIGESHGS